MSRLARNITYNLSGQVCLLVLSFLSARFVFGRLGGDALGIIYFTLTLNLVIVAVLEFGISMTLVKEISANVDRDQAYVLRLVRSAGVFYWGGYVVAAVAIVVLAPSFVEHWIELETLPPETAVLLLRILGVSTILCLPQMLYVSVFRGIQRMGVPNAIDVLTMAIQQGGTIAVIAVTSDVTLVAVWIATMYVVKTVLLVALTARLFPATSIRPKLDMEIVRRNRRFGTSMMLVSILATVHTQTDKLVISALLPVASVGIYAFVYGAVARGGILTSAVSQGAFPALSALVGAGDRENLAIKYRRLHNLLCYGLVPFFAFVAFATLPLFSAVFKPQIAAHLVAPGCLLSLGFYMNGTLHIPYNMSLARDRPDIGLRLNFLALFGVLPVTVLLTWRFGFTGAAASWVWYHLFAYAVVVPRICRDCIEMPVVDWFRHIARVLALIACSYGLAAVIVFVASPCPSVMMLGGAYLVATIVFMAGTWLILDEDSRSTVMKLLKRSSRAAMPEEVAP